MPRYALLISARATSAYFAQTLQVAQAELAGVADVVPGDVVSAGDMQFLTVETQAHRLRDLLRLSCVQGAFEMAKDGFLPVDAGPEFRLHADFVWGEKYRGKTSEILTQLLINIAIQTCGHAPKTLLDPMCGRGTTLLQAMRVGLSSTGVELDGAVLPEMRRSLKKWTKLHRQKHKLAEGWVQKANKKGVGKFLDFAADGLTARVVVGDTTNLRDLVHRRRFDLLVSDVPYGVQHMGGATKRSPIEVLRVAAPGWADSLVAGGALAVAYNAYLPKPEDLRAAFDGLGLDLVDRRMAHRMSESILRDVLVMRKS